MSNLVTIDLDRVRADLVAARQKVSELEILELAATTYGRAATNGHVNGHVNGDPVAAPVTAIPSSVVIVTSEELAGKTVHDAANVVLKKAAKPIKTIDVVASLRLAGFGRNIANLQASVFTALSRKRELFRKVSPGVWRLATPEEAREIEETDEE